MLSLCDSVDNKHSNNSAALHLIGPNVFASTWVKKYARVGWAGAKGQKNTNLSCYLSYLTR